MLPSVLVLKIWVAGISQGVELAEMGGIAIGNAAYDSRYRAGHCNERRLRSSYAGSYF